MTSSTTAPWHRLVPATLASAALVVAAVAYPAIASGEPPPGCPNNTVRIQGEIVPAPENQVCDDDPMDGLLGGLPVVGSLPGVGGAL